MSKDSRYARSTERGYTTNLFLVVVVVAGFFFATRLVRFVLALMRSTVFVFVFIFVFGNVFLVKSPEILTELNVQ